MWDYYQPLTHVKIEVPDVLFLGNFHQLLWGDPLVLPGQLRYIGLNLSCCLLPVGHAQREAPRGYAYLVPWTILTVTCQCRGRPVRSLRSSPIAKLLNCSWKMKPDNWYECWCSCNLYSDLMLPSHFPSCFSTLLSSGTLGFRGAPASSRPSRAEPGDDLPVPKAQYRSEVKKLPAVGGEP